MKGTSTRGTGCPLEFSVSVGARMCVTTRHRRVRNSDLSSDAKAEIWTLLRGKREKYIM